MVPIFKEYGTAFFTTQIKLKASQDSQIVSFKQLKTCPRQTQYNHLEVLQPLLKNGGGERTAAQLQLRHVRVNDLEVPRFEKITVGRFTAKKCGLF